MLNPRTSLFQPYILAVILLAAGAAHAQQQQPQPWMVDHHMMDHRIMGQHMTGMTRPDMMMGYGPMIEGRLAYLKAELAITEAQTKAWDAYVTVVRTRSTTMQTVHMMMMQAMQSGTAVARLDAHIKAMETMTETLKAMKPVTEGLYAVLTAEQKTKADQLLGMGCCMM